MKLDLWMCRFHIRRICSVWLERRRNDGDSPATDSVLCVVCINGILIRKRNYESRSVMLKYSVIYFIGLSFNLLQYDSLI